MPYLQNWKLTVTTKFVSGVKGFSKKGAEVIYQLKKNFEAIKKVSNSETVR